MPEKGDSVKRLGRPVFPPRPRQLPKRLDSPVNVPHPVSGVRRIFSSPPRMTTAERTKPAPLNTYPFYSPRFWHGMRFRALFAMWARNRFRIHPLRWPMAVLLVPVACVNSLFYRVQNLLYAKKIERTELVAPPVFIVGHWRSGTTMLHEMMVKDEQFAFSETYDCFAPNHFLATGSWLPKMIWFLMPRKRPMDDMATAFDLPQEDEFALLGLGTPTPYLRMAFPNEPAPYESLYSMSGEEPELEERFGKSLTWFFKALTVKSPKRLILKSPPHCGRLEFLSRLFPGAKFIYIARSPYRVIPSTDRLWRALDAAQGFQLPKHRNLENYVFDTFDRLFDAYESQRGGFDEKTLCEMRYEDLVKSPLETLERVYRQLELPGFEAVRPKIVEYLESRKDFRPNKHELDAGLRQKIGERCEKYLARFGYAREN